MPLIWFLIFLAVCAFFAFRTGLRVLRGDEVYIAGEKPNPVVIACILALFLIVMGLFVAIQLGLIPDHAP